MGYNVKCLITGKTENLRMHAFRNEEDSIVGWVFVHQDVDISKLDGKIKWDFDVKVRE